MDAGEPTDAEIVARLAAQPVERWEALFAAVDRLTPADVDVAWRAPRKADDGVITVGYPLYSETVETIRRSLGELQVVVPFDWMSWTGHQQYGGGGHGLAEAPVADAVRMATAILRGERFGDEMIAQALRDGTLLAVLNRLRRWFTEERGSLPSSPPAP